MREYYEDLWERLPAERDLPHVPERRALMLEHVRPGSRVLDLGCGDGAFAGAAAAAGGLVTGVDVAEAALRRGRAAHPDVVFRLAPCEGPLPLPDAAFDVVWASEVIQHVADTARFLSEVRRVMRPGAVLLVTTPSRGRFSLALTGPPDPQGDDLRLYTRRALRSVLWEFGFAAVEVRRLRRGSGTLAARARRG